MTLIEVAEIIGILSFSLSGFFIAVSSKLDILGVFIASFLTALGGGVIRDVLVGRELYAFSNNLASILVISVVIIAILFKLQRFANIEKNTFFMVADTLGLVSFAISGALVGVEAEFNFFGVILLSLITAVGGGVLRDMLINKIPMILVSEFYGTVAIFVGVLIYTLGIIEMLNFLTIMNVFFLGVGLRFFAFYKDWHLPKIL
ncbi:MAG TPA: trimeric intracellular cation channel family protein [Campylobacterales bacterium]|nr:trimeric intracellular cation channel family protein [Campylobacterales bacterium]HIP58995.1 trimeric intracellular cation channel family protein [Campylobacterales bacterium]